VTAERGSPPVREIGVALLGLGNVGAGVVKLLEDNAAAIGARLGGRLVVRAIAARRQEASGWSRSTGAALLTIAERDRPAPTSTSSAS
jgi:homoserine dehydrogenase